MNACKSLDLDAFSSGQIESKLWLCRELERLEAMHLSEPTIWLLAGWYASTALFLLIRQKLQIKKIVSFDQNPECAQIAECLHEAWGGEDGLFSAVTMDIARIDYAAPQLYNSRAPDLVVNTACEHMISREWFEIIPPGNMLALQSTDLEHCDHYYRVTSVEELLEQFPLSRRFFSGEFKLQKGTEIYHRFMAIGIK
jgi:hypothetical protein